MIFTAARNDDTYIKEFAAYRFNLTFYTRTERTEKAGEAKRSPLSPDFPTGEGNSKKSGDNSDRKIILSSEWQV